MPDLLAGAALGIVTAALLLFIALLPPPSLHFSPDQLPEGSGAQNLYGVEHNAAGPYRWAKPDAAIILPLPAPGTYRLTLTLQDLPELPSTRPVSIYLNGALATTAPLGPEARRYPVEVSIPATTWAGPYGRTLTVEMHAPVVRAPGDPRALGPLVAGVALEPLAYHPVDPTLFGPALLLIALAYGSLRLLGTSVRQAVLALVVALTLTVLPDRERALWWAYQPAVHPLLLVGVALAFAPLIFLPLARHRDGGLSGGPARLWRRDSWPLGPVVAVALLARLHDLGHLSLWLDEGYTIRFSRLPWPTLLGLGTPYDVHPPLYYAATKLASAVVPEVLAGRLVSALAGTLTCVVVYACAARLLDRRVALVAALVVALSPYHIWYSQEARMYALAVGLTALSYLALLCAIQEGGRLPLAAYGLTMVLALYADTSAAYALAPQAILWAWHARRDPRRAAALAGAALVAGVTFAPWLLRSLALLGTASRGQATYLAVTSEHLGLAAISAVGLGGQYMLSWGTPDTPWTRLSSWHLAFVLAIVATGFLGIARAAVRAPLAALAICLLTTATYGVATLVSLVAPGFDDRTLVYVTCGWGLLVGGLAARGGRAWIRTAGYVACAAVLTLGVVTAGMARARGEKQEYRELAAATARAAATGVPIVTADEVTTTLLDVYQPQVFGARHLSVTEDTVIQQFGSSPSAPNALWFAYGAYSWLQIDQIQAHLATLGFTRVDHQEFPGDLHLDLYARPGASALYDGRPHLQREGAIIAP